jgi:hypothetical protein
VALAGLQPFQRLVDSIEPLFGHATLRPADDPPSSTCPRFDFGGAGDDTSSAGRMEEQSPCRAEFRTNSRRPSKGRRFCNESRWAELRKLQEKM